MCMCVCAYTNTHTHIHKPGVYLCRLNDLIETAWLYQGQNEAQVNWDPTETVYVVEVILLVCFSSRSLKAHPS